MTKPIKIDEIYEMKITGLSHAGEGIGRIKILLFRSKCYTIGRSLSKDHGSKENFGRQLQEILISSQIE